jgi:hypothetical protein
MPPPSRALYLTFIEGEGGAEGYAAAVTLIMGLGRAISGQADEPDMSAFLADPIFL